MRALAMAIEQAGSLNKTAMRDALKNVELNDSLMSGQVLRFGKTGQAQLPFVIVQNKPDDKSDIVYPKDAATGKRSLRSLGSNLTHDEYRRFS